MKKSLLITAAVCIFSAAFCAAETKTQRITLDKSGCLLAGDLRFAGDIYNKRVNHSQRGKSWKCDKASFDKISGVSTNVGKIIIPEFPAISYATTLARTINNGAIYTLHISGTERNFTVRTSLPAATFAGREISADGKKILLRSEKIQKGPGVASGSAASIGIPCSDVYINIEFEKPVGYTIHDYRPGTKNFSLLFSVPKVSAKDKLNAVLRFKVTAIPYKATPVDISKAVNMGFADEVDSDGKGGWTDQGPENDLRMVPTGKQRFKGTDFYIINAKKNNNKACIALRGGGRPYFPESATAEVNGKLRGNYLTILHARAWKASSKTAGNIIVKYTDGSQSNIAVSSKDMGNWWSPTPTKNGDVAWVGENASASVGLFKTSYAIENKPISAITFKSTNSCVWLIAAASVSDVITPRDHSAVYYIVAGKSWKPIDFTKTPEKNSVMDFSHRLDAPAGKYGKVIVKNSSFVFEKRPDTPIRFYGSNLCSGANFVSKEQVDTIVKRFARMGFNILRLHHHDGGMADNKDTTKLNPVNMDKIDYLIAKCKENGIYITTDFYVSRRLPAGEIPEYPGKLSNIQAYKALFWLTDSVWENWKASVTNYINHVNPYTGMRLIDDPVLVTINIINEGNIKSHWATDAYTRKVYEEYFEKWRKARNLTDGGNHAKRNIQFEEFLTETYEKRYAQMVKFLRGLGVKTPFADQNMGTTPKLSQMRRLYDFVDNHGYFSHPNFPVASWKLPSSLNQRSPVCAAHVVPWHLPTSRLLDKPFTVTEFDYAKPNRYRAAGPALIGAIGSYQDWDMLVQFAFSHGSENFTRDDRTNNHFDLSTDCVKNLAHRIGSSFFLNGGAKPAKGTFAVLLSDRAYIPFTYESSSEIAQLAQIANVGTCVIKDGDLSKLPADTIAVIDIGAGFPKNYKGKYPVFKAVKGKNMLVSDIVKAGLIPAECYDAKTQTCKSLDGKLALSRENGTFSASSDCCDALVLPEKKSGKAGLLAVKNKTGHGVFGLVSADGKALAGSRRILLLHLTDTQATKAKFGSPAMNLLISWGVTPFLAAKGEAEITISLNPEKYTLYAVNTAGKRLSEVKFNAKNGKISFNASVFNKFGQVFAYELAAK